MNKIIILIFLLTTALLTIGCVNNQTHTILPTRQQIIPTSSIKINSDIDKHPPILHSTQWQKPIPLAKQINTAGAEDSPFVTPDGNTLYFFFTPDVTVPVEKQVLDKVTGIYVSKKINDNWTEAERVILQKPNKLALDGCEFVQNNKIYFCSAREGYTGLNWFRAERKDGQWKNIKKIKENFSKYEVGELHINSQEDKLYFHSGRAGGKGQYDIWESSKYEGLWQEPKNITIINSPEADGWPFISEDNQELWFTRNYKGTPALYRSQIKDGQWQQPELIISQFAGEPSLDKAGNLYFVHHYFNNGQMLEADIYVAYKK